MLRDKIRRLWYCLGRLGCILFVRYAFRLHIRGAENVPKKGAVILASNHQSFLDPVLCGVGLQRQLTYMARDTLFKNCFFRQLIGSLNAIPLKRDEADITAMRLVIERLKAGSGVLLFPEATRTSDGRISEFKPGLGLLCRRGRAAVVPVLVEGAFECWPRTKKIFSIGSKLVVRYGKCISQEEAAGMSDEQLAKHLTETLRQMQSQVRKGMGKRPLLY